MRWPGERGAGIVRTSGPLHRTRDVLSEHHGGTEPGRGHSCRVPVRPVRRPVMTRAGICLGLGAILGPMVGAAQEAPGPFVHRAWGSEDGLPQMSMYAIQQSRDGYLWIGTLQGLVRFDGSRFTRFSIEEDPGLSTERVVGIIESGDGSLWISTQAQGLARYQDGAFRRYTVADGLPSNSSGPGRAIVVSRDGGVLFGTDRGAVRFVPDPGEGPGRFVMLPGQEELPSRVVMAILEEPDGRLWLGTDHGLATRSDGDTSWRVYGAADGMSEGPIGSLLRDRAGVFWVGTEGAVARLDPVSDRFETFPLEGDRVIALLEDRSGTLWAGSPGGGLRYFDGRRFAPHPATEIGSSVVQLHEDDQGNLWVGTNGNGLHRLKPSLFTSIASTLVGSLGPMTHGVMEDDRGEIWAGTYADGLLRVPPDGSVGRYGLAQGLRTPTIWSVAQTPDGTLWVGSETGLLRYNPALDRVEPLPFPGAPELASQRIAGMTVDPEGTLWVGTFLATLFRLDPSADEGPLDVQRVIEPGSLPEGGAVNTILPTGSGTLWVGTQTAGLLRFDGERRTIFLDDPPIPSIRTLVEREDGSIWAGTYGRGLCAWRARSGTMRCLTSAQGLPDNTIHAVREDDGGFLWMSSNQGLFRLRAAEVEAYFEGSAESVGSDVFTRSDGLPDTEFNGGFQPTSWETGDGRLLFPTTNGIAVVEPGRIEELARTLPRMHVEGLTVDGVVREAREGSRIPPGTERLTFTYTGIHLGAPAAVRFAYRLDGYDAHGAWIAGEASRTATYTRLPPGHYRFRVRGAVGSGPWTEASMALELAPLFHETTWFRILASLGILGLVAVAGSGVSRARFRQQLLSVRAEQALASERARISRDMHDEVGASLTEIAILSDIARHEGGADVAPHLARIGDKSRRTLDAIGEIIWAISPSNDQGDRFAAYLREYAADFLESAGLEGRLQFPPPGSLPTVGADVRRALFLILKESLANVVKHAGATNVTVCLERTGSMLELTVADDGVGPTPGEPRAFQWGQGLGNMAARAREMSGEMHVEAAHPTGWCVRVQVPLSGPEQGRGS